MDCGPACLKMVAAHYGRNYPMEYLRQEMGITREGVSLKGICVAAREIGMQTTACRMSMGSLCEDVTLPCIIHWNQNHFVVVYKIAHGKVYVADPGKGMIHYSMAEFASLWTTDSNEAQATGIALLLEPTDGFYAKPGIKERRGRGMALLRQYATRYRGEMASSLVKGDPDRSAIRQLWQEMRQWRDSHYPHCALIAEWANPAMSIPAGFDVDFFMHFNRPGYPSLFFDGDTPAGSRSPFEYSYFNRNGRGRIDQFIDNFSECYRLTRDRGYIGLPTANHDFQRLRAGSRNTPDQLRVAMTFLLTMPGIPFVYYGDEIGMRYQPDAPDVEGATDRAGSRTPMQWEPGPTAGFSTCAVDSLYLPVSTDGGLLTVRAQEADPRSLLHYVRHLLWLRRDVHALGNDAGWTLLSDKMRPYPMVYRRSTADDVCIVAVNPSAASVSASIPTLSAPVEAIAQSGKVKYKRGATTDRIVMGPVSAVVYRLSRP